MPSLFNPWVLIGLFTLITSALGGGYYKGHHDAYLEQQAEVARLNEQARDKERELAELSVIHATELRKVQQDAQAEISRVNADLESGALRLSVACSAVQPTPKPTPTPRTGVKARCEIDQRTARSLVGLAAEGDEAIRQLNALIDFYNDSTAKLNER